MGIYLIVKILQHKHCFNVYIAYVVDVIVWWVEFWTSWCYREQKVMMKFTVVWIQSCLVCCYDKDLLGVRHELTSGTLSADGKIIDKIIKR